MIMELSLSLVVITDTLVLYIPIIYCLESDNGLLPFPCYNCILLFYIFCSSVLHNQMKEFSLSLVVITDAPVLDILI
jgi:hypothetical protein